MARMIVAAPDYVKGKYKLHKLKEVSSRPLETHKERWLTVVLD